MRLRSYPRADGLFRRLPRPTALSALELLLLVLIAVQGARLAWTLVSPVGPVGDWRPAGAAALSASDSALTDFDPFFRLSAGGGPAVVTGLDLKLYGVREDRATGRGSAIIALPDGTQRSFAVGEEVMPGVRLASVGFDHVTIDRNGLAEQIFLDQSQPAQAVAQTATPTAPTAPATAAAPAQATAPAAPNSQIGFRPRMSGGRMTGLAVSPGNDGGYALRAAGLMPGDVIVSINGQRVTSLDHARVLVRQAGGQVSVVVNRRGRDVPLQVSLEL